jgi:hypothetical protein
MYVCVHMCVCSVPLGQFFNEGSPTTWKRNFARRRRRRRKANDGDVMDDDDVDDGGGGDGDGGGDDWTDRW